MVVTKNKVDDHLHYPDKEYEDDGSEKLAYVGTNCTELQSEVLEELACV